MSWQIALFGWLCVAVYIALGIVETKAAVERHKRRCRRRP